MNEYKFLISFAVSIVQFLIIPMLQTMQARRSLGSRNFGKILRLCATNYIMFVSIDLILERKLATSKIINILFVFSQLNYQLGEADAASRTDILNLDIAYGGPFGRGRQGRLVS